MEMVIGGIKCGITTRSRDAESRNDEMKPWLGGYNYLGLTMAMMIFIAEMIVGSSILEIPF